MIRDSKTKFLVHDIRPTWLYGFVACWFGTLLNLLHFAFVFSCELYSFRK